MSINEDHFRQLLDKYANNRTSPEETAELFALIKDSGHDEALHQLLVQALEDTDPILADEQLWDQEFGQMLNEAKSREADQGYKVRYMGWRRLAVAACVLLMISFGGYFLLHKPLPQQTAQNRQDILPGGNKAVLTLANGQKISLTDAKNGTIARQAGVQVNKTKNGQLVYTVSAAPGLAADNGKSAEAIYNTIETPRGGQYQVVLPDGSKVWLNAASSITYPVAFNVHDRTVKITGEAYFEVTHNAAAPFRVSTARQLIEDIGTHFNVNAYADEPSTKTTLLEGAVKVNDLVLKPGQQAVSLLANNTIKLKKDVDLDGVTAWKNNYFLFDGDDFASIMRKVSRWYDADVVFTDPELEKEQFTGTISRFKNVSSVLHKLELTGGVHFQIKGRQIIITK